MAYLSTGEVSKKLNVSLRTLRYYDEIGLVKPAVKEESGKRYYTPENLILLQKVLLLKAASISLEDIRKIVNEITIQKTLGVHKGQLEYEIEELQQSLNHTNTLINTLKIEGDIQWEQLLPLLSKEVEIIKQQKKNMAMENLFSVEEQEVLVNNLPKMENDSNEMVKWINIIKRIELCLSEGKSPESQEGQLLAIDIQILTEEMFKGNHELANKFWEARKSEKTSEDLKLYPVKQEFINFIEEAMIHCEKIKEKS